MILLEVYHRDKIKSIYLKDIILVLGVTWNSARYCIGDELFIALGILPWSNGSSGTHYPAVIGIFVILVGISMLNLTLNKKNRLWIWTTVILLLIVYNLVITYM